MAAQLSHTLRVALYARISAKNHGQDPEAQLIPLREYAKQGGFIVVGEYVDVGILFRLRSGEVFNLITPKIGYADMVTREAPMAPLQHELRRRGPQPGTQSGYSSAVAL